MGVVPGRKTITNQGNSVYGGAILGRCLNSYTCSGQLPVKTFRNGLHNCAGGEPQKTFFSQTLGASSSHSMQDALENDELTLEAVTRVDGLGFSVISAGSMAAVSATQGEEFYLEGIGKLIDMLRGKYRYVLIDSPPVLPYVDSDIISAFVDGVAIVVEANSTRSEVLNVAINRLKSVDAKIVGLILNKREFYIPKWLYKFI